jgi:uncharacterized membrane protein
MDSVAELLAWRIGGFKFGVPTLVVGAVALIIVIVAVYAILKSRRQRST